MKKLLLLLSVTGMKCKRAINTFFQFGIVKRLGIIVQTIGEGLLVIGVVIYAIVGFILSIIIAIVIGIVEIICFVPFCLVWIIIGKWYSGKLSDKYQRSDLYYKLNLID